MRRCLVNIVANGKRPANTAAVLRANAALLARGGRRMPGGYLQPDAAKALNELVEAGYAPSPLAVIVAALFDARRKIDRNACVPIKNVHNGAQLTGGTVAA